MNKYKKLAMNTMVFAIGSFGSKILVLLLTRLYTGHLSPAESGVKNMLELTALFLQPIFTFALQEYLIRFGHVKIMTSARFSLPPARSHSPVW